MSRIDVGREMAGPRGSPGALPARRGAVQPWSADGAHGARPAGEADAVSTSENAAGEGATRRIPAVGEDAAQAALDLGTGVETLDIWLTPDAPVLPDALLGPYGIDRGQLEDWEGEWFDRVADLDEQQTARREVLRAHRNASTIMFLMTKYDEAEHHLHFLIDDAGNNFGPEDPDTLTCMHHLAVCVYFYGLKYATSDEDLASKAIARLRNVTKLRLKVLGKAHPDTLASAEMLAKCLLDPSGNGSTRARAAEAETVLNTVVHELSASRGERHVRTLRARLALVKAVLGQGEGKRGRELLRVLLADCRSALGRTHPDTLLATACLADALLSSRRVGRAERFWREVASGLCTVHGERRLCLLRELANLAHRLSCLGMEVEAEPLHRAAVVGMRALLGDDEPGTLRAVSGLAKCLFVQGNFDEAEEHCIPIMMQNHADDGEDAVQTWMGTVPVAMCLWMKSRSSDAPLVVRRPREQSFRAPRGPKSAARTSTIISILLPWVTKMSARLEPK